MPTSKLKSLGLIGSLVFILLGCGIMAKNNVVKYIPNSKYRTVLVMVFRSDNPNSVTGLAAADAMAASLNQLGFIVVDREYARKIAEQKGLTGNPTIEQVRDLAKELNVNGIVQGTVSELGERQEDVPGYVETRNNTYDAWGRTRGGDIYAQGAKTQTISKFAASAKLTDINNGSVVWSQSLSDSFVNSTVQSVANSVMSRMALDLGKRLASSKL
jgi:hypothetical protein